LFVSENYCLYCLFDDIPLSSILTNGLLHHIRSQAVTSMQVGWLQLTWSGPSLVTAATVFTARQHTPCSSYKHAVLRQLSDCLLPLVPVATSVPRPSVFTTAAAGQHGPFTELDYTTIHHSWPHYQWGEYSGPTHKFNWQRYQQDQQQKQQELQQQQQQQQQKQQHSNSNEGYSGFRTRRVTHSTVFLLLALAWCA
jgi:hypothetical protein